MFAFFIFQALATLNSIAPTQRPNEMPNAATTPLLSACQDGDLEKVTQLLKGKGIKVNQKGKDQNTPLLLASSNGHWEVVMALLRVKKIKVDVSNSDGDTALHFACDKNGDKKAAKKLLEKGCNPSTSNGEGWNPVHVACWAGNICCLKEMLNHNEGSAFEIAQRAITGTKKKDIVNVAINNNGKDELDGSTPLHLSCEFGNELIVKLLLSNEANPSAKDELARTPLLRAFQNEKKASMKKIIKQLLKTKNIDVTSADDSGSTPLHYACTLGDCDIVSALIKKGAYNIYAKNEDNTSPQLIAFMNGTKQLKDAIQEASICVASQFGNMAVVKKSLEQGTDVNQTDHQGLSYTPLHFAARGAHLKLLKFLLKKGANPLALTEGGMLALHFACRTGNMQLVLALTGTAKVSSASVGRETEGGKTPLHVAAASGSPKSHMVVLYLIGKGANCEVVDNSGRTPLHFACLTHSKETAKVLLERGADKLLADKTGKSPVALANDATTIEESEGVMNLDDFLGADSDQMETSLPAKDKFVTWIEEYPSWLELQDAWKRHRAQQKNNMKLAEELERLQRSS